MIDEQRNVFRAVLKLAWHRPWLVARSFPKVCVNFARMAKRRRTPMRGWHTLSKAEVTFHRVPGNHITMLTDPDVAELARQLRASIDAAAARTA